MISKRYLVVSRGPAERLHFDIVVAKNKALAEDKVREARKGTKTSARNKGWAPVALEEEEVRKIANAMEFKSDELVEERFKLLRKDVKKN